MDFPKRMINSFQTSWNKLAKLSIRKLTLTSETLYIHFLDVGTYELLSISPKPLMISNWNFTCIHQRHIGIRKYQYLNFDQVPHLDPKSHGWWHIVNNIKWINICEKSEELPSWYSWLSSIYTLTWNCMLIQMLWYVLINIASYDVQMQWRRA